MNAADKSQVFSVRAAAGEIKLYLNMDGYILYNKKITDLFDERNSGE